MFVLAENRVNKHKFWVENRAIQTIPYKVGVFVKLFSSPKQ